MKYRIEAVNALGASLTADHEAPNRPAAIAWAEEQGLQVVACELAKLEQPKRVEPTYQQRLSAEIKMFRKRHGIVWRGGEDAGYYCDHKLSAAVLKRYGKLSRMMDQARGEMPWPAWCYQNISRPSQRASWRTMEKAMGGRYA